MTRQYIAPVEVVNVGAPVEPWAVLVTDPPATVGTMLRLFARASEAAEWAEEQWPGLVWHRRTGGGLIAERAGLR